MDHLKPTTPKSPQAPSGVLANFEVIAHQASRQMSAVQRTPVGKRLSEIIRNLVWVIPLSLLIWVYAEREQVNERSAIPVEVRVKSERSDRVISLVTPGNHLFYVDLKGTNANIADARRELDQKPIEITIPGTVSVGPLVALAAQDEIASAPVFVDRGIVITGVSPNTLTLDVDEVVEVDVRPELPEDISARLSGQTTLEPPTVRLRGPQRILTNRDNPPRVVASITEQMLPKVPGPHEIASVPLQLKTPHEQVTITPTTVKARLRVRSNTRRYTIPAVPVFIGGPKPLLDRYGVAFDNDDAFMRRITVIGPEDQVNRIESGELTVYALLVLQLDDGKGQPLPRPPSYVVPKELPDVRVTEEDRARTIAFKLQERQRAE